MLKQTVYRAKDRSTALQMMNAEVTRWFVDVGNLQVEVGFIRFLFGYISWRLAQHGSPSQPQSAATTLAFFCAVFDFFDQALFHGMFD